MNDPELQGKTITKDMLCQVGGHVFFWINMRDPVLDKSPVEPPGPIRCYCGQYTYQEWKKICEKQP